MKKIFLLCAVFFTCLCIRAQKTTVQQEKPIETKISGFIMNNMFYDSRKNLDALDGMVLLFPLKKSIDTISNEDIYKYPNMTLLSFASRLKFSVSGPDAFGAKTAGYIEYDFTSRANSVTLRFRQAWAKLNWENTELLVGRAWHPLASIDVIPSVMALSIGAPFQPFNRSEQITLTQKTGKLLMIFSASYQNDYVNNGPSGKSFAYQNNALLPNLHLQLKYKSDEIIAGIGADFKRLKPKVFVVSTNNGSTKTDVGLNCPAFLAYGKVTSGKLTVSAKTILAYNTSESLMTGAFAVTSTDTVTGREEYAPYKHFFAWGNVSYGSKLKGSLFAGYLKNLGATEDLLVPDIGMITVYGLGETIGQMIRITPTVSYTSKQVVFALELEHNIAAYGTIDYADKGKIKDTENTAGTRILATMFYNF